MSKIVFLILHYYTLEDTINCIKSIQKLNYKNKEIVVVDNGSTNESGNKLEKIYSKDKNVHIIISKQNLGFARGNNFGFKYAKEKLNPSFIVMCNNDVFMIQNNFCELLIDEYDKSNYDVLGPKIYLQNNIICSYPDKLPKLKKLQQKLIETKIFYILNKIHLRYVYSVFSRIKKIFIKEERINTSIRKEDVVLNGCCLIFSKNYISSFDGIDDRTFLYYEEQLLYIRLKKNNMKSVYNPNIEIFHNEGVSTKMSIKNKRKKFDFKLKNEIESLNTLISEMYYMKGRG